VPPLGGAGTYQWVAIYSGDSNNKPISGSIGDEPELVIAPKLTIVKTGNGTVSSGDIVSFTIVVTNTGLGTAFSVSLSDPLPDSAHLNWVSDAGVITNGTLTDAMGDLASGQSVTIHVSAVTPAGFSATLNNTATATASNEIGSVSSSSTDIVLAPDVDVLKAADRPASILAISPASRSLSSTKARARPRASV